MTMAADEEAILATVSDYIEGWSMAMRAAWNGRCIRSS